MSKMSLTEAINVPGVTYIGSAKGYDLFDINTYAGAQAFENAHSHERAGADWTQNESTFNSNVGENLHLYFFVLDNTNEVRYAVIKGQNVRNQDLIIKSSNSSIHELIDGINISVENVHHQPEVAYGETVPLYLIPNIEFGDDIDNIDLTNGCYYANSTLRAVLPQFCPSTSVAINNIPDNIREIAKSAFCFGQNISEITLTDQIEFIENGTLNNSISCVLVDNTFGNPLEAPEDWPTNWADGFNGQIRYGIGLSDEDRAELEAQAAARAAEEAAAAEEAERQRLELERIQAEREAKKIRYKVVGNEVTIKGTRKGVTELSIPAYIEGKPVTRIEAYAFYGNTELVNIKLPITLKVIETGAFILSTSHLVRIFVPKDCQVFPHNNVEKSNDINKFNT